MPRCRTPGAWPRSPGPRRAVPASTPRRRPGRSPDRPEGGSHLGREELGLFPGREVAALVDGVEVDDVRVARLDPAARRPPDLAWERREAERDRRRRQGLLARGRGVRAVGLPIRPRRGRAGARQPVQRDVVEHVLTGEVASGYFVDYWSRDP